MNETPKLWPHAWSLIRGQQRVALVGLVLTLFSIAASLLQPWPLKIIVDSILGSVPMPASLAGFADNKPAALLIEVLGSVFELLPSTQIPASCSLGLVICCWAPEEEVW